MNRINRTNLFKYTPFRVLLPSTLMILLFAGSIFMYLLPSIHKAFMDHKKETIQELTGAVINSLGQLKKRADKGEFSQEQARAMGIEMVKAMRYGLQNKDYFWINDTTYHMVMHPYRPDLNGKILSKYKDKTGKYFFIELVKTAHQQGGGFVDYYWQWKDQPDKIVKKISYVREFKPWGWVIGTGIYLDDVEAEISTYRNKITFIFLTILLIIAGLKLYILRETALTEEKKDKILAQRERLVQALREGEERYRTIADFAYDWEIWINPEGAILYCSPSCKRITGYPAERFFETPELVREIILSDDRELWDDFLVKANSENGHSLDFRISTDSGETLWLGGVGRSVSGIGMKPLGLRCSFRDITERKQMEDQLRYQALHDPLTKLANRTLCLDRVGQALRRAKRRDDYYFAIVFLDLDRFKVINDSLGHLFGDMVLSETSNRLNEHVRGLDTVSRFGGDEFVLLLDELSSPGEAIRIIKRIRMELAKPFSFNGHTVQTTASFGIVLSPVGDTRPQDLLQHANIAMHRAKDAGRNRFKVFTGRMLENAVDLLTLENDMRQGLINGEFHVQYQPIMDLCSSDLVGFEALARWNHPKRGPIPPSEFIPLAEEAGLIIQLGEWVLKTALETMADWRKESPGAKDLYMSVNLSSKQFARMELDKIVLGLLSDVDLPPTSLKLEITESVLMDHPEAAVRTLTRLRKSGIHFSIDDFGTGYSSLSQLQQLPVDTLKIDKSFIQRMSSDSENMEIVKAVIALAHSLDLTVVAEGVEESDQLCSLLDLDCQCIQGFFFHRPMSTKKAMDLLKLRETASDTSPKNNVTTAKQECQDEIVKDED